MAKYFATSLAIEKVVSEPRVIRSCLPISTMSMSLVGSESRAPLFPVSFAAADLPDERPPPLLLPDERHLLLRGCFGEEVVDTRLRGDDPGGARVVAGD